MLPDRKQIELEALALDHALIRNVIDIESREIRLPRYRAERREFRAAQRDHIVMLGMLVFEGLEQRRIIFACIAC